MSQSFNSLAHECTNTNMVSGVYIPELALPFRFAHMKVKKQIIRRTPNLPELCSQFLGQMDGLINIIIRELELSQKRHKCAIAINNGTPFNEKIHMRGNGRKNIAKLINMPSQYSEVLDRVY